MKRRVLPSETTLIFESYKPALTQKEIEELLNITPKYKFGELPIINLPSLGISKCAQEGTIKVVSFDPLKTILEFTY
jgi:hypothetical protein